MTLSLILACLWLLATQITAMVPSRHHHWPQAYALIALGLPILIYVFVEMGALAGLVFLAAALSVLRWPVIYLWRWIKRGPAR